MTANFNNAHQYDAACHIPRKKGKPDQRMEDLSSGPNSCTDSMAELQANFHSIQKIDLRSGDTLSNSLIQDDCKILYEDRLTAAKLILLPSYAFCQDIFCPHFLAHLWPQVKKKQFKYLSFNDIIVIIEGAICKIKRSTDQFNSVTVVLCFAIYKSQSQTFVLRNITHTHTHTVSGDKQIIMSKAQRGGLSIQQTEHVLQT